jgi:hypothetical protein
MQGKARLGAIVHQKNAAALALTAVKNEDQREFAKLVDSFKSQFNEGARVQVRAVTAAVGGLVGASGGKAAAAVVLCGLLLGGGRQWGWLESAVCLDVG